MNQRFAATDALATEIENDLAKNPGAVAIIFCLDEAIAPECAKWLTQQDGRLLVADQEFTRGAIRFPAGGYRLHKSGIFHWPDDGPPLVAPLLYIPVKEETDLPCRRIEEMLGGRLPRSPEAVGCGWCSRVDDTGS